MRRGCQVQVAVTMGLALVLSIGLAEPVSASGVRVVVLQPLPGVPLTQVADVNNSGTVFGGAGHWYGYRAVRWDRTGRITLLDTSGSTRSWLNDANDAGVAVGWAYTRPDPGSRAMRWMPDGQAVRLEMPPGGAQGAVATRITEDGVTLGMVSIDGLHESAARWDRTGQLTVLQRPPAARHTHALNISGDGMITGYADMDASYPIPLRWDRHGRLAQLGAEGFWVAANNRGIAVGTRGSWPDSRPARWDRSGQTHELGRLTDGPAFPAMVNNSDIVVGTYYVDGRIRPIMWSPAGRPTALTLLPGFTIGYPAGINRRGEIAGVQRGPGTGGEYVGAAVRWDRSGQPTILPTPPGTHPYTVAGLNDHGDVIGTIMTAEGEQQTVLWLRDP